MLEREGGERANESEHVMASRCVLRARVGKRLLTERSFSGEIVEVGGAIS